MNQESWQQLKSVFHTALELAPEDRAAFLAQTCEGESTLRAEVEGLLRSNEGAGSFLLEPALVDAGVISAEILEKSFADSPTDEAAHFKMATVQAELGRGFASLASNRSASVQHRLAHWRESRSWSEKSLKIYKAFRDAGKTTGEEAGWVDVVTQEVGDCDKAIARLIGNGK